jgi:hypothetical protein
MHTFMVGMGVGATLAMLDRYVLEYCALYAAVGVGTTTGNLVYLRAREKRARAKRAKEGERERNEQKKASASEAGKRR